MFWKKQKKEEPQAANVDRPFAAALQDVLKGESDPTVAARLAGREIATRLFKVLQSERGVRIETALGMLGSLAGVSAPIAMAKGLANGSLKMQAPEVVVLELKGGGGAMTGDYINRKILEAERVGPHMLSVWGMAAGQAEQLGAAVTLDRMELVRRVISQIGEAEFGHLDLPEAHHPGDSVGSMASSLFPAFEPLLDQFGIAPEHGFLPFSFAIQDVMQDGQGVLAPDMALKIVMECAVPASKMDGRAFIQ